MKNKYSILTPTGFKDFSGVNRTKKLSRLNIQLANDDILKCSLSHKFIVDDQEILASSLDVDDYLDTSSGKHKVISIEVEDIITYMYDAKNVKHGHVYYTNNILSHNCDADFITSGETVIPGEKIEELKKLYMKPPIEKRGFDGNYWLWSRVNYNKKYMVVADVARGDGNDYSGFHVIDLELNEQVAEYKGKLPPKEFGNFLVAVCHEWNTALLVIENANIGWAAIQPAIDSSYPNLFYSHKQKLHVVDVQQELNTGYDLADRDMMIPGFSTTPRTRPLIISKLESYVNKNAIIIRSERTYSELMVFIWHNGKAQARSGYNDDLTMALSIGLWVRDTALRLIEDGLDLTKAAIHAMRRITPPIISGNFDASNAAQRQYHMPLAPGRTTSESIKWLL